MNKIEVFAIGVMSGTSLDGVDLVYVKFDKNELQVSIDEFKELLINEVTPPFCSGLADKDNLFKGYSDVGLIEKIIDSNNEFIMEIKIDKSSCYSL